MHFQYIDEAGSTGADLTCKQQPVFTMASLVVSDEKWKKTERAVHTIVSDYFDGLIPDNFELHGEQLLSPNGDGPFNGHDRNKRNELALNLLQLISDRGHSIFLTYIYKGKLDISSPPKDDFGFDWKYPWQIAFDIHLTMFEEFLKSKRTGSTSTGLVILDHMDDGFEFLREQSQRRQSQRGWREIRKIVEIGYSVSSHANPMIQLSDLVAFTMKKYFETKIPFSAKWPPEAATFYQACKDTIWGKVQFKNLSFQKLNVKASFIDFMKEIRKP